MQRPRQQLSLLQAARNFSSAVEAAAATTVLSWGVGVHGALGTHSTLDQHEPEAVPGLPPDIAAVGAGHFCSFAATAQGELWSWGRGGEGQLGRPLAQADFGVSAAPAPVDALRRHQIVAATGSGVASFALARDGSLLSFGSSKRGQLGLGAGVARAQQPRQLRLPGAAVQVAAGWGHAAALLEDGSVWTWGWPAASRLGHSFAASAADEEEGRLGERCCWEPRRVELLRGLRIRQVACGFDHTLALAEDGSLFSFGDNSLLQLGRASAGQGPAAEALAPPDAAAWLVNPAADCGQALRFRRVAAGLGHCLGVLEDGNFVSWGWNAGGQCGQGQFVTDESIPRPSPVFGVPDNRHALMAAGRVHSVLVTEERSDGSSSSSGSGSEGEEGGRGDEATLTTCYSWGAAQQGRLGTGQLEDAPYPELVPDLDGAEQLLGLACGLDHTLVLAAAAQQ